MKAQPKPRKGDRHRPGYMREYMKAYRARKKAKRSRKTLDTTAIE